MLQNVLASLQGVIDQAMVGNFVGSKGNAALGDSWQIILIVVVFLSSLFTGMGVLVARFAGANQPEKVNRVVYQAFLTAFGLSVLLATIGYFASPVLLDIINAAPEVQHEALPFLRAMFIGIFGMGDVQDFRTFLGAVIDRKSFAKISGYLDDARTNATIIHGGTVNDEQGFFVAPTLVEAREPGYRLLCEEIFGPVVTAYAYPDAQWTDTLALVDRTSPYALTGAVFARDRRAVVEAKTALRNAAGNFYINDKPTGAVVGQQPFGGARASGTNDKAGSKLNLVRWVSARTIKETFSPPRDFRYPYMSEE